MAMPVLKATGAEQNTCPHTGLHSAASSYDPSLHSASFHRRKHDAAAATAGVTAATGHYKAPSSAADYQHALKQQQQQQMHRAAFGSCTPRSNGGLGGYPSGSFDSHAAAVAAAAMTPAQHQHQHIIGLPPQQRVLRESLPRTAAAAMPLQPMVLVPVPMAALMPAGLMRSSSSSSGGGAFEFSKASAAAAADEAFLRSRMQFNHYY
jgi:hypothetical protein